jgi:hypothetical protein
MAEVSKWMIDPNDAVMLLIDHQSGLFNWSRTSTCRTPPTSPHSRRCQARQAPDLHHGLGARRPERPLIPEIHAHNPDAVYIPRTGQINAWDNGVGRGDSADRAHDPHHRRHAHSVCMAFPL